MGALEAFVVAAQHRSLKAASAELNLSVSALSRRIQGLEAYVGKPLFERLHRELRLTADGEWLMEHAAPAFDALARVLGDMQQNTAQSVTIGVPPSFAASWLFPRIARFKNRYPDIEIGFDSSGAPFSKLGGSLDAVIVFSETVEGDLYARRLKHQAAFAVCRPDLLPPGATPRDALRSQTILLHRGLPRVLPVWLEGMRLNDAHPLKIEYFDSGPMLLAAAEAGLGLALTLEDTVRFYLGGTRLARPFGEAVATPYSYYFACKRSALTGRALRRFHDWLFAEVQAEVPAG